MIPKGVQNADAIIEACNQSLADLGEKAKPEWKENLDNVINTMERLKTQFFIKTNLAIPVTKACLKDVSELQSLAAGGDLSGFPEVMARLQTDLKKLHRQAKMDGIALT